MTNFNYSNETKEFFGNPEAFTKTSDFEKMLMGDMSGYESPIRMIVGEMQTKMEADTMSVIQRYGIDVDKEELIKALSYDREQYNQGYQVGYRAGYEKAKADLIKFISEKF